MEVNMRLYIFLSHLGLAFILMYSFMKYNEFYSAVVYLSTEKFPRTIIYNFFLMVFIILCKLLLNIFIGELRYLEVEQLIDNARAFIMDTILFLVLSKPTINGKEVSSIILIKYLSIIVILKAYHLVLYSRVSHIFELGVPRTRVLVKLFIFMCLLSVANLTMFTYFYKYSLKNSTMYLWLFFESLSIFESCQISILKFFVNIIDLRSANGLSSKATILFFLDILHDIMSLIIFLVFILVFILNNFSNLPLHMTADIIHVVKTLISRFKSFQRYRELTKNIETKFADATEEELKEVECLKSWFIQQQTCPICRTEIKPQSSKENAQNEAKRKEEEQQQQPEEDEKKEQKANQLTIQEIITKASFLPCDENSPYLNDPATASMFPPKEDDCVVFAENVEVKQRIKILADLCDYYRELCLTCLKEIDKINYAAVPANVMLRNIYGSRNYNMPNNAEEDEVKKYLTKISHVPQMSVFKSYLERVLIEDMKYTKEICSLM